MTRELDAFIDDRIEGLSVRQRKDASPAIWQAALRVVMTEYAQYTETLALASDRCSEALCWLGHPAPIAQGRAFWTTDALVASLKHEIAAELYVELSVEQQRQKSTALQTRNKQRYLLDYDLSYLCLEPPLIIDLDLRAQTDQKHPGILAAVTTITALYDDQNSRRAALTLWRTTQDNATPADLDALGPVSTEH